MKIAPVNNNILKNNTFKGLWGNIDTKKMNSKFSDYYCDTEHYYPFADETDEEISKLKSGYPRISNGCYNIAFPFWCYETLTKLSVHEKLPIFKAEWKEYTKNFAKADLNLKNRIEQALKKFNLQKHLIK